ncbi:hypothetical protein LSH36_9g12004 [Paralvinella palmiformis]|uniref:Uncharacterized protein n=1 Tax=Paralvinella palmiformis TaxID=53620 RepID=A0AAD9KD56_9ANNE|nr:hypothetical protein LSH36_9g12004 [Paralvinella palmiformis]
MLVLLKHHRFVRYLEVESSGRRDEIRLHYYPHPPGRHGNHPHPHTQIFLYHLADDRWHQLALTISTHFVKLFIDCQKIHETQISHLDLSEVASGEHVRLWPENRIVFLQFRFDFAELNVVPHRRRVRSLFVV